MHGLRGDSYETMVSVTLLPEDARWPPHAHTADDVSRGAQLLPTCPPQVLCNSRGPVLVTSLSLTSHSGDSVEAVCIRSVPSFKWSTSASLASGVIADAWAARQFL